MIKLKNFIKEKLTGATTLIDLDFLIKLSKQELIMPFYHTVSNEDLIHVKHLYPILSIKRFNEDLDFFKKKYKPITAQYLIENKASATLRQQKSFFLSFDDGLRQFNDVIAPILLKKGIPATFFVNSSFIDNKDMFYRLKISILIEKILQSGLTLGQKNEIEFKLKKIGIQYNHPKDLLRITDKNKSITDIFGHLLEIDFTEYLDKNQPYLTSYQIENLVKQGFTLGAHSVNHPYFPALTVETQIEECINSLNFIKERFGVKEALFSFPYTDFDVSKSFFEKTKNDVDISFGTANLKLDSVNSNFQRIPMEVANNHNAESILKNEYLFFTLKMLINNHIIIRK